MSNESRLDQIAEERSSIMNDADKDDTDAKIFEDLGNEYSNIVKDYD
ncbi:hypothetical protein M0R19_02030 [Candidatus Pacearchaeota archaeon]|nr:hypothetical protein [Candidatus Pacearchaeota archaeon]